MPRKIPAFLPLPGPGEDFYIVRIQQVKDATLPSDCYAEWDAITRTVRIPRKASRRRKLLLLDHELRHVAADYLLWLMQGLGLKDLE